MRRWIFVLFLMLPVIAHAVEPDEILQDAVLEARAREISKELRCVVCQNQNIDSSNAGVARDLRLLVRERLILGDTDAAVIEYVRARYGDYVLMNPPLNSRTYALWFGPFILALLAILTGAIVLSSSRKKRANMPLSSKEHDEIDRFIEQHRIGGGS